MLSYLVTCRLKVWLAYYFHTLMYKPSISLSRHEFLPRYCVPVGKQTPVSFDLIPGYEFLSIKLDIYRLKGAPISLLAPCAFVQNFALGMNSFKGNLFQLQLGRELMIMKYTRGNLCVPVIYD